MGVCGVQVFEDDMACAHLQHCLTEVPARDPFDDFRESLQRCLGSEYVETDLSGEVLVVAMLLLSLQKPSELEQMSHCELAEPFRAQVLRFGQRHSDAWASLDTKEQLELFQMCVEAIDSKVLNSSCCESYQLWMDTEELDEWVAVVEGVKGMLERVGASL